MKIKIPCIVNEHGDWNAIGCSTSPPEECLSWAFDGMEGSGIEQVVWIEAEIPVPEAVTVEGKVVCQK